MLIDIYFTNVVLKDTRVLVHMCVCDLGASGEIGVEKWRVCVEIDLSENLSYFSSL